MNLPKEDACIASRTSEIPCADRVGGASRDRTDDPLLAKQVLSQLSYGPGSTTDLAAPCTGLLWMQVTCVGAYKKRLSCSKGGDPAAPSDTATLLRLHPSHRPHRGKRPPCG